MSSLSSGGKVHHIKEWFTTPHSDQELRAGLGLTNLKYHRASEDKKQCQRCDCGNCMERVPLLFVAKRWTGLYIVYFFLFFFPNHLTALKPTHTLLLFIQKKKIKFKAILNHGPQAWVSSFPGVSGMCSLVEGSRKTGWTIILCRSYNKILF